MWFCDRVLGFRWWGKQQELAKAVRDDLFVPAPATDESGKGFSAASIGLWYRRNHPDAIVVTTAPTARQVRKVPRVVQQPGDILPVTGPAVEVER